MSADDANEAVGTLNGKDLLGRNIKLEIAAKKGAKQEAAPKVAKKKKTDKPDEQPTDEAAQKAAKKKRARVEDKPEDEAAPAEAEAEAEAPAKRVKEAPVKPAEPKGPRTVTITGFPEGTTKTQVKHRVKKVRGAAWVEIIRIRTGRSDRGTCIPSGRRR